MAKEWLVRVTECVMGERAMGLKVTHEAMEGIAQESSLCGQGDSNGVRRRRNMSDWIMGDTVVVSGR